jgi:Dihaem cytochrome c
MLLALIRERKRFYAIKKAPPGAICVTRAPLDLAEMLRDNTCERPHMAEIPREDMVFPPQFLPKRSWQKLVETLADHFGENASLGEAQRQAVLDYLLAHAADSRQAGREGRKFARSIAAGQTPLRITDTPRWVQEHRKVRAER